MFIKAVFFLSFFLIPLFSNSIDPLPPSPTPVYMEGNTTNSQNLPEHSILNKSQEPSYEHAFMKMILTLGGLLFLVFFTLWAIRKLSRGKMGTFGSIKKIKILEKRPLSPKTVLYLLELDGKQVFISESQLEVKKLLEPQEIEMD